MATSLSKLGNGEGQGSMACCSPWGHRVGQDLVTEQQQALGTPHWASHTLWNKSARKADPCLDFLQSCITRAQKARPSG